MLVGLWVTTACNLCCTYCYEGEEKKCEYMDRKTADVAIDFMLKKIRDNSDSLLVVQFHGGEPLLNEDIVKYIVHKLIDEMRVLDVKVMFGITTNGLLLNAENVEFLMNTMEYDFSISIDGKEKTHDLYRKTKQGQGTYRLLQEKISKLLKIDEKNVRARMTFNSKTVKDLSENVKHVADIGFKTIVSIPDYFDNGWNEQSMQIFFEEIMKIHDWYSSNSKYEDIYISLLDKTLVKKGGCSGGISNFHILPNGDIYPCSYGAGEKELLLGNIFEKEQLNVDKVNDIQRISEKNNPECIGCSNIDCCIAARCKIVNKITTGNYLIPNSVICNQENIKYQYMSMFDK